MQFFVYRPRVRLSANEGSGKKLDTVRSRKILILRHGETIWNTEGRLQGCQDIPLTDNGVEQIRTNRSTFS